MLKELLVQVRWKFNMRANSKNTLHQKSTTLVRIHAAAWTTIFNVTLLVLDGELWDADAGASVPAAEAELVPRTRLVLAGQPALVARAIPLHMLHVVLLQAHQRLHDHLVPALNHHGFDGEVVVAAGSVPVSLHHPRRE